MKADSINLTIKPTLDCNVQCIYCHSLKPSVRISSELLELVFQRLADYCTTADLQEITLHWHGGEPMIMGAGFFQEVLRLKEKYLANENVSYGMQSNISLYKGPIRETLRRMLSDKGIGACMDPFHSTRPFVGGRDSANESLKAYQLLRKDGFQVEMIYVVHKKSVDVVRDVYYFFKNLRVSSVLFHPLEEFPDPEYYLSPEDWGFFLQRLFEVWKEDHYRLQIHPLDEWYDYIVFGEPPRSCEYGQAPAKEDVGVVLSPQGDLYPCHRFQDKGLYGIGNIRDMNFDEIVMHPLTHLLHDRRTNVSHECLICEFLALCGSGCVATHDETGKTLWCRGLKTFFHYLTNREDIRDARIQRPGCAAGEVPGDTCYCKV
jgi:uncharacterized protein